MVCAKALFSPPTESLSTSARYVHCSALSSPLTIKLIIAFHM